MFADCKSAHELRNKIKNKTIEELEHLLVEDFKTTKTANAEFIKVVLEVIEEKELEQGSPMYTDTDVEDALRKFNEMRAKRSSDSNIALKQAENGAPHKDHLCKKENRFRKTRSTDFIRSGIVAAATIFLICSCAWGRNVLNIVADWTEDILLLEKEGVWSPHTQTCALDRLRIAVSDFTDIPSVPTQVPDRLEAMGNVQVYTRQDRTVCSMGFKIDGREFSIQIIVHTNLENFDAYHVYQKNDDLIEEYVSNGIVHYITGNASMKSVIWLNGNVEGMIQGNLTIAELREMIDSIY